MRSTSISKRDSAACYSPYEGQWDNFGTEIPCSEASGIQSCCAVNNTCLGYEFCYNADPNVPLISGFYLSGCTDPSGTSSKCPQHCSTYPTQDVVYTASSGLWACCYGSGELNCNIPSNETFYAPPPATLLAAASTTSTTSASSTTRSTVSRTTSTSPKTNATSSTSASSGEHSNLASIVVPAVAVPVVAVLFGAVILLWWYRRGRKTRPASVRNQQDPRESLRAPSMAKYSETESNPLYEMGIARNPDLYGSPWRAEMSTDQQRAELDSERSPNM